MIFTVTLWMQQALALGQTVAKDMPSVTMIVYTAAAGFIGWWAIFLMRAVMAARLQLGRISDALYGPPESKEAVGLLREASRVHQCIGEISRKLDDHRAKEGVWQYEISERITRHNNMTQERLTRLDTRLEVVEERLSKRRTGR